MKIKEDYERFLFPDGTYQDLPNDTTRDCLIVGKDVDVKSVKIVNGELISKTVDEKAAEAVAEFNKVFEQAVAQCLSLIDDIMDSKAKECGYDGIKTAVTYADEPAVPKFQSEGKAFRAWRSLCYAAAYSALDEAKSTGVIPELDAFIEGLPALQLEH